MIGVVILAWATTSVIVGLLLGRAIPPDESDHSVSEREAERLQIALGGAVTEIHGTEITDARS